MAKMLREVLLHARHSLRHSMRSGNGVTFVVFSTFFGLGLANLLLEPIELGLIDDLEEFQQDLAKGIGIALAMASLQGPASTLGQLFDQGQLVEFSQWAKFLVLEQPMVLSATFLLYGLAMPLLIPLGSFSIIAADAQSGAFRYLLTRSRRWAIILGRFLGALVLADLVLLGLVVTLVIYIRVQIPVYSWEAIIAWGSHGLLALLALSIPYVALSLLISASVKSPRTALLATVVSIAGVPLIAFSAQNAWEPLGYLLYLLPWAYSHQLLHPDLSSAVFAGLACLGHGAVFLLMAMWVFERRDL